MLDYLLRFADEPAAIAALGEIPGDILPVALVLAEAVYGEPEGDDAPSELISPREVEAGFWLIAGEEGLPGQVAAIERATGWIVAGETSLAGARLDPAWAGAEPVLSVAPDEIAAARAGRLDEARAAIALRLAAGAPIEGLHVALDDGSRADITAMGTTALAALGAALAWPDSYAQGWITVENIRIPLPTPEAGLTFADAIGTYYGGLIQRGRDLKDAIAVAGAAALAAIDIDAALDG